MEMFKQEIFHRHLHPYNFNKLNKTDMSFVEKLGIKRVQRLQKQIYGKYRFCPFVDYKQNKYWRRFLRQRKLGVETRWNEAGQVFYTFSKNWEIHEKYNRGW